MVGNVGLQALFLFLTVTFFLLGSGEYSHNAHKVICLGN
jgi:succinate-acetate transporter protein